MNILKNIFRRSNDEEVAGETKAADNPTSRLDEGGASGVDIDEGSGAAKNGRKKKFLARTSTPNTSLTQGRNRASFLILFFLTLCFDEKESLAHQKKH